jgi:hypothetical protein
MSFAVKELTCRRTTVLKLQYRKIFQRHDAHATRIFAFSEDSLRPAQRRDLHLGLAVVFSRRIWWKRGKNCILSYGSQKFLEEFSRAAARASGGALLAQRMPQG